MRQPLVVFGLRQNVSQDPEGEGKDKLNEKEELPPSHPSVARSDIPYLAYGEIEEKGRAGDEEEGVIPERREGVALYEGDEHSGKAAPGAGKPGERVDRTGDPEPRTQDEDEIGAPDRRETRIAEQNAAKACPPCRISPLQRPCSAYPGPARRQ